MGETLRKPERERGRSRPVGDGALLEEQRVLQKSARSRAGRATEARTNLLKDSPGKSKNWSDGDARMAPGVKKRASHNYVVLHELTHFAQVRFFNGWERV